MAARRSRLLTVFKAYFRPCIWMAAWPCPFYSRSSVCRSRAVYAQATFRGLGLLNGIGSALATFRRPAP